MIDPQLSGMHPSEPRSLRNPDAVVLRRNLLQLQSHALLADFVRRLREAGRGDVPDIDPLDGGLAASMLLLFEKPGPMTDAVRPGARQGSGFISQDNDDPTAEAIFHFLRRAGIDRRTCLLWNMVPWWNGTRRIRPEELRNGQEALAQLLPLLKKLRVVVLVGRRASNAGETFRARGVKVVHSAHPSPIVRATRRAEWDHIPEIWAGARGDEMPDYQA
jgi:hypothetical protein